MKGRAIFLSRQTTTEFFSLWVQVARRIAIMEVDLERAEDRAEAAEA